MCVCVCVCDLGSVSPLVEGCVCVSVCVWPRQCVPRCRRPWGGVWCVWRVLGGVYSVWCVCVCACTSLP